MEIGLIFLELRISKYVVVFRVKDIYIWKWLVRAKIITATIYRTLGMHLELCLGFHMNSFI